MATLYPEIEPFDQGMLDVGDGNQLYWEVSGNPQGKPALILHGGSSPSSRRFFDPAAYRVVVLDQRGCGNSTPNAAEPKTDLMVNTTAHLVRDIERLRQHLGIARWLICGGSWGTTLGLAYAEQNPSRVTEMVLFGVTTTRRSEIDWLYHGLQASLPEQWARFRDGVPADQRDGDLVEAYYHLPTDPDPAVRAKAALDWHEWEAASISADPNAKPPPKWSDPQYRLTRARIVTHYFHHYGWLEDEILLQNAHLLAGIPGVLVQGLMDLEAPPTTALELAERWPDAQLIIIDDAGHSAGDRGMTEAILAATDRFARATGSSGRG
jgi:proline iminopeptidase